MAGQTTSPGGQPWSASAAADLNSRRKRGIFDERSFVSAAISYHRKMP